MPKEIVPAINLDAGGFHQGETSDPDVSVLYHNTIPIKTGQNEWSLVQRPTYKSYSDQSGTNIRAKAMITSGVWVLLATTDNFYKIAFTSGTTSTSPSIANVDPTLNLVHDAADSATVFTDSGESWTVNAFVDHIIYNSGDGSIGVCVSNTATTITVDSLTGGADNTFQSGDTVHVNGIGGEPRALGSLLVFNDDTSGDMAVINDPGHSGGSFEEKGSLYYSVLTSAVVTRITDVHLPGNDPFNALIRGAVELNGYLFISGLNGKIFNCTNGDITSWPAADFIVAERNNDKGIYIGKHQDHVVWFGNKGIEFFYDAANTNGSPLNRRQDIYYSIRSSNPNSFVESGNSTYFIGVDDTAKAGLFVLENFNIRRVESPMFDSIINRSQIRDYDGAPLSTFGTQAAVVSIPGSGSFYVYTFDKSSISTDQMTGTYAVHLETGIVSKWYTGSTPTNRGTDTTWTDSIFPLCGGSLYGGSAYGSGTSSSNKVLFYNGHIADLDEYNDSDSTANQLDDLGLTAPFCGYYTHPIDFKTNDRKRINKLSVLHYPSIDSHTSVGTGLVSISHLNFGEEVGAGTLGGYDKDDFSTARTVGLSTMKAQLYRGGIFRMRTYKIEFTPGDRQTIKGLELDYDLLRG